MHDGDRVVGATLEDGLTGSTMAVRATRVLDATGVWNAQPDRPFGAASF